MLDASIDEVKPLRLTNPRAFKAMGTATCARLGCSAWASCRIGKLDACGRHTTWALNLQVENGKIWTAEEGLFIGRYYR